MTAPIANVSGLSSGMQWNDIVSSTTAADEARLVRPITDQLERGVVRRDAWSRFRSLVNALNDAARAVRASGFGGFRANVPASPASGRALLGVQAGPLASPGRYRVEVLQRAENAKVAGREFASRTAALGIAGDLTLNGRTITVEASDSLTQIRDRFNAANTGPAPTGISASIVSDGADGGRLVLTKIAAGEPITDSLIDGTGGLSRELGILDSHSRVLPSVSTAVAAALGIDVSPPPASIRVGDRIITVDLQSDSLSSIMSRINAAGGQAAIEPVLFGDETRYRLVIDGNVQALPGNPDSAAVVAALGITEGGTRPVRQVVQGGVLTRQTGAEDVFAASNTRLTDLRLDGVAVPLSAGDAINVRGVRGDGSIVTVGITVGADDRVADLLARLNDPVAGFGAGDRPALATLGTDGRLQLTDSQGGTSRLAFSLDILRDDGTTGSLGTSTVAVQGRLRQLQAGQDAIVRVDGVEFRRATNAITDAIPNVTLSLLAAEPGTAIDIDITRDTDGAAAQVKALADAYNEIQRFFNEQRQPDAPLYGDTQLRSMVSTFTAALRTQVTDNVRFPSANVAGLALDQFGILQFDRDRFSAALTEAPAEVEALFGFGGVGGAFVSQTDAATSLSNGPIFTQVRNLEASAERLRTREAEVRRRIEARREALVRQFTNMESVLRRLNSQGTAIAGLTASLLNNPRR
jgi:flagellar hook-associated protein 2